MGSARMGESLPTIDLREFRSVLRRWPNVVLTMVRNRCSSHPGVVRELRDRLSTPLFTFGGGLNTVSETVKR